MFVACTDDCIPGVEQGVGCLSCAYGLIRYVMASNSNKDALLPASSAQATFHHGQDVCTMISTIFLYLRGSPLSRRS